jgi:cytochrome c oxidase subunit 2
MVFRKQLIVLVIVLGLAGMACSLGSQTGREPEPEGGTGEQLFQSSGCTGCHDGVAGIAPSLDGLYGEEVLLEGGETEIADEEYLQESILDPQAKVVQGYQPVMPDYRDQLSDAELEALVMYIVSLGD